MTNGRTNADLRTPRSRRGINVFESMVVLGLTLAAALPFCWLAVRVWQSSASEPVEDRGELVGSGP